MPRVKSVHSSLKTPIDKIPFIAVVGIVFFAALAKFILFGDYLNSKLLFQDDSIFLGHYYFNVPIESPNTQDFYYRLVELITSNLGILGAKTLLMFVQAGISLLAYLIVNQFARAQIMALGLSITLMHFPVAIDQNFFVIGAHPQFGVLALFAGFYCLLNGPISESNIFSQKSIALTLLAAVCFFIGSRSSPTLMLMPILFAASLVFLLLEHGFRSNFDVRHIWAASTLSVVSGGIVFGVTGYHYSSVQGWVDISAPQILENLAAAFLAIAWVPFEDKAWFLSIFTVGVVFSLVLAVLALLDYADGSSRDRAVKRRLVFLGFLVICAACLFGPGSVTTSYLSRYVIAPYCVMALGIGCLIGWAYSNASSRIGPIAKVSALSTIGGLSIAVVVAAGTETRVALAPYQNAHEATVSALGSFSFEDEDQILVLLPDSGISPTSGFNHWSTWYLRVLTQNASIIGLVGTQSMYDPTLGSVFVDNYSDHDERYWAVKNGRSFRLQLVGLETDRRLFTFLADSEGDLKPGAMVAADENGEIRTVQFGEQFFRGALVPSVFDQICEESVLGSENVARFVDDRSQEIGEAIIAQIADAGVQRRAELIFGGFEADGEVEKGVSADFTPGEVVEIGVSMSPKSYDSGSGAYSESFPPMPLLSSAIAVYHIGTTLRITTREEPSQSFTVELKDDELIEMRIVGCVGGRAAIIVGDEIVGSTTGFDPSGEWLLGKGFLSRFWQGEFRSFVVTHFQETAEQ